MSFSVTMLGTASAAPFSDRNPSAQALSVHGRLYLLDCGEGTQQRLCQEHLSFAKVRAVFISHTHGDHIYGLFGLLSTLSLYHRTEPLPIFGPQSLGSIIDFFLSSFGEDLGYSIEFTPISIEQPTPIFSDGEVVFSAFPLRHSVECYGYICTQTKEHRGAAPTKCSYAYCSDTASFPELPSWLKGVDVLYHEATYPAELSAKADEYLHSTTIGAATCALEAGVDKLIIGHYSSRVKDIGLFEAECRTVFANTTAANDGDVFEINSH